MTGAPQPPLIYDYYGFPAEAYAPHLTYPCKGDLALARQVHGLLKEAHLPVRLNAERGYDHGVFIPLKVRRRWERLAFCARGRAL